MKQRGLISLLSGALLMVGSLAWADDNQTRVEEGVEEFGSAVSADASEARADVDRAARRMGVDARNDATRNQVTTNPLGLITGDGLNAQYSRSLNRRLSGVVGAEFGRLQAGGGTLTKFGGTLGVDWYAVGQFNEGLRIGPRLVGNAGSSSLADSSFNSFGAGGELGYNYVSSGGLTAGVGVGLNFIAGGLAEDDTAAATDDIEGVDVDRYGRINLGYSW